MIHTGIAYTGHFDVWLINHKQMLLEKTSHLVPYSTALSGWINDNFYAPADETIDMLSIPDTVHTAENMQSYNSLDDANTKHRFPAHHQDTIYAIISVNTPEEKKQFKQLIEEHPDLSGKNPDWKKIVLKWNANADGETIFYKVSYWCIWLQYLLLTPIQLAEHLQSYYTKWKKNVNEKFSISQVITKVQALKNKHQYTKCSLGVPAVIHLETPKKHKKL